MGKRLSRVGYREVFREAFTEPVLDRSVWNVELHEPGWVNKEWQAYIDSPETIRIENGVLHIRAIRDGDRYYSGRISTEGKRSFTYGIFEAELRVPRGKGYLPAFWLMSEEEQRYGCWPCCGEIDIMEVLGDATRRQHGTIHFGLPHDQRQGTLELTDGDFAERFHTFSLRWEEGLLEWYVDGECFFSTSDWYATDRDMRPWSYPAPFDHPMYIILNLAVGGEWVGYPDETTPFAGEGLEVRSVTVYQKEVRS